MPARERGRKRLRASSKVTGRLAALRLDMEEPLNDAIDAAQALRFIGYGISLLGSEDEGRAISSLPRRPVSGSMPYMPFG